MNILRTIALLAVAMLVASCDKKSEELDLLKPAAKLPNTAGLPVTTNLYAQIDLKLDPQQKQAYAALLESLIKTAGSKAEGRTFLRKTEDAIGRLKDAGFGDFTRGDLDSVTFGMTLPESPAGFENFSIADADITLIIRGKFKPALTRAFCQAERIQESLIEGQLAWNLGKLIEKLTGDSSLGMASDDKSVWFAYANDGTLAVGTRGSLRKSLAALKGERASLKPIAVKAVEDFKEWNLYLCFNNPRLIEAATAQAGGNEPSDRVAAKIVRIMPHDQALVVTGARGDSEAIAVILSNEATQENIQYSVSASKSLTPKFLKIYSENIGELIGAGGHSDKTLADAQGMNARFMINEALKVSLIRYRIDMGDYPSTEEGLQALSVAPKGKAGKWRGPYVTGRTPLLDPWNEPFQYRYPGVNNVESYDLFSKGRDRRAGTDDDIGNW